MRVRVEVWRVDGKLFIEYLVGAAASYQLSRLLGRIFEYPNGLRFCGEIEMEKSAEGEDVNISIRETPQETT
jgi:hypothetical protein